MRLSVVLTIMKQSLKGENQRERELFRPVLLLDYTRTANLTDHLINSLDDPEYAQPVKKDIKGISGS